MKEIAIVAACRTPVGAFLGGLSTVPAHELGKTVLVEAMQRAKVQASDIDEVIMGQVLTTNCGQNPARQAAVAAGIPVEKTAYTINQVCGSGLRAVALAAQSIALGDTKIALAGGQENMSLSPHAQNIRNGQKMGDLSLVDTMVKDGLWDAFNNYHMGITAENIAEKFQIDRNTQDEFALNSQQKAAKAQQDGKFKQEIVAVKTTVRRKEVTIEQDEHLKPDTTADTLSSLRTAFKKDGTVTAGNASGLNDGAAVVLLMSKEEAEQRGLKPLAIIKSWATAGVDPEIMGTGPVPASKKALEKAGWQAADLDLIEANEAFAAQACSVNQEMGWDTEKVNVHGGAIALGHPIGASGCRVLVTLLHAMQQRDVSKGLATLCIGGGMGIAMCVER